MSGVDAVAERLAAMGFALPAPPDKPYASVVVVGDTAYVSGHGPKDATGRLVQTGKLGDGVSIEEGYVAARYATVQCLASLKHAIGSLDRIDRVVKVLGFVASTQDFHQHPSVMHGCTDLLVELFGARGKHARSAIGTNVLPNDQSVEIEMIVKVTP